MGLFGPTPKNRGSKSALGVENIAIISTQLIRAGYTVLNSYGLLRGNDLLIEDADGKFWRIWCRTAWFSKDRASLCFSGPEKKSDCGVGYFAVYHPRLNKVYLLPTSHVRSGENTLRLVSTDSGRESRAQWAEDYEL